MARTWRDEASSTSWALLHCNNITFIRFYGPIQDVQPALDGQLEVWERRWRELRREVFRVVHLCILRKICMHRVKRRIQEASGRRMHPGKGRIKLVFSLSTLSNQRANEMLIECDTVLISERKAFPVTPTVEIKEEFVQQAKVGVT